MIRKDLIVAVIATFCLTATLFWIIPTRSQEYNPWTDYDENGKINILDIVPVAISFGASGDPTKNVTITGHATKLAYNCSVNVDPSFLTPEISVAGYSKFTVCLYAGAITTYYELRTKHRSGISFTVDAQTNFGTTIVQTYDVPNELIQIFFSTSDYGGTGLILDVYLIA